jgi:chaperonin GroES
MSLKFEPKAGCMVVQVQTPEEKTASGVIIPMSTHSSQQTAKVVRMNRESRTSTTPAYREGDLVIIDYYNGKQLELEGAQYVLVKIEDVLGRLEV